MVESKTVHCAFLDLLGFTNQFIIPIENDSNKLNLVINSYKTLMEKVYKSIRAYDGVIRYANKAQKMQMPEMTYKVISDSIVLTFDDPIWLIVVVASIQKTILEDKGLALRGGISLGFHWEKMENNNYYLISPAFVNAYRIEQNEALYARVVVNEKVLNALNVEDLSEVHDQNIGVLVQSGDDKFCVNFLYGHSQNMGGEQEEFFTIDKILQGMRGSHSKKCVEKWRWMADLYNFELMRLKGNLQEKDWEQYYLEPKSTWEILRKKFRSKNYCDYLTISEERPNQFIDIQDLYKKTGLYDLDRSAFLNNSFHENKNILLS